MAKFLSYYEEENEGKYLYAHIPASVVENINEAFKSKKSRYNALKLYALIFYKYDRNFTRKKRKGKNVKNLYVELSSKYFEMSVCHRYYKYIKHLKQAGIIEVKKSFAQGTENLFQELEKESYCNGKYSKKYRPLIYPIENDPIFKFDQSGINDAYLKNLVYKKNLEFLKSNGFDQKIYRDNYMFRYYTSITNNYKELVFKGASGSNYVAYDIKSSVPQFIREILENEQRPIDKELLKLYDGDFYSNLIITLVENKVIANPISRDQVKQLFATIIFGNRKHYSPSIYWYLSQNMPSFMKEVQYGLGYRAVRNEVKYLEGIIPKIQGEVLTIHDALILSKSDEQKNLNTLTNSKFQKVR